MADLTRFQLRGYDEDMYRIECLDCPPRSDSRVWGGRTTLARAVRWATEHQAFLHDHERTPGDGTDRADSRAGPETARQVRAEADSDDPV